MANATEEAMMGELFDCDPRDPLSLRRVAIKKSMEHRESWDETNGKPVWNETDDSTDEMRMIEQTLIDDSYDTLCAEHFEISKSIERRAPYAQKTEKPVKSSTVLKRADLRCLKICYGKDVSSYLKESNIVEKKSISNAYILSKEEGFEECHRLFRDYYDKRGKPKEKNVKKKFKKPAPPRQRNCYDSPAALRRIVNDDKATAPSKMNNAIAKPDCPSLGVATNLTVSFENCYGTNEPIEWLSISRDRKSGRTWQWDYENVFKLMMETDIGSEQMIDYTSCFDELKVVLKEFHRKHEKFDYCCELRHTMNIEKFGQFEKIQPVTLHQFQKYFSRIFFAVIPLSLFGKHRNVKKVRKALKQYFFVAYNEKISLTSFVHSMDISCITWLRPIRDEATRWSVIAKVTKWIFERYLCAVLKAVFSVQRSLHSEQKVFMCSEDWIRSKRRYIRREEKKGAIKKISLNSRLPVMCTVPCGEMKLFPKNTGVRSIHVIKYADNIRAEVDLLRTLLQQCYLERYEHARQNDLHSVWRSQTSRSNRRKTNKLYLVACDVAEAYGSIIQTKLFDIINAMISEIPEQKLRAQWYKILGRPRWETDISLDYKRWFTCCPELPVVRTRALVRPIRDAHHAPVYIEKITAINWIKDYIFNQTFQFNKARYIQTQGVAQGSVLSPVLADIYYSHMRAQEFHSFVKSGSLIRYIDDFLYITKNEVWAKRFLKAISQGIPEYNCRFRVSKTQTNVRSTLCKESETIAFLGYRLSGTSLGVRPQFDFSSFRYSKWLRKIYGGNSIQLFTGRLINKYALKMNNIVMSHKINSVHVLVENAELIARMMASRCVFFISTIFNDMGEYSKIIMETICVSITKIARKFQQRLRLYGLQVRIPVMRRILIAIWTSFLRVFSRNIELRKQFGHTIKRKIKRLKAY